MKLRRKFSYFARLAIVKLTTLSISVRLFVNAFNNKLTLLLLLSLTECLIGCSPALVQLPCSLPPIPNHPPIQSMKVSCPPEAYCLDAKNKGLLYLYLNDLETFVTETQRLCGVPAEPSAKP